MKKFMKSALMIAAMCVTFAACGGDKQAESSEKEKTEKSEKKSVKDILKEGVTKDNADQAIDALEANVDKALQLLGKATKGDEGAMKEFEAMSEEMDKLTNNLDSMESDLTAAQKKRLADLEQKAQEKAAELIGGIVKDIEDANLEDFGEEIEYEGEDIEIDEADIDDLSDEILKDF